jgi:F420-dependent oxidoreductase-like protein
VAPPAEPLAEPARSRPLGVPVGYAAGTDVRSVPQARDLARWAASAGFDGFWLSQILGVDPVVALAAIGADVPQLAELGTSVVPLYGRHPLALAAQARTAQSALDGRFVLGIGPSHQMVVEGFFGESYARPFTRTAEYLDALVPLLEGGSASVAGTEVTANGWLTIEAQPVPVLLAALGTRMLDLAGRVAAGTTVGQCGPRTIATHIAPRIREAAAAADRPPPRVMALVTVCVTDDLAAARANAAEQGETYARLPAYRAMLDREGVDGPADLLVAGSIGAVVEGLRAYVDAGVTDLRLGISAPTDADAAATREALADLLRR